VNHAIIEDGIRPKFLEGTTFHADIRRRLAEVDRQTGWTDISKLLAAVKREAESAKKTDDLGWATKIPMAVVVVERHDLQQANEEVKPANHVQLGLRANPKFLPKSKEGDIVPTSEFNAEEVRLYAERAGETLRSEDGKKALEELEKAESGENFQSRLRR